MHFDFWTLFWTIINFAIIGVIVWVVLLVMRYFKNTSRRLDKVEEKIKRIEQQDRQQ